MNRALAFLFFMLFLAGLALAMLKNMQSSRVSSPDPGIEQSTTSLTAGDWHIETTRTGQPRSAFVRFLVDGGISGFAGCNSFFGTYVVTGKLLEIGQLGATRKACEQELMQAETGFLRALGTTAGYRVSGNTLWLQDAQGQRLRLTLAE